MSLDSVLHVVPSVNRNTGGPAESVPGLAAALSRLGVRTTVVSLDYGEHGTPVAAAGARNLLVLPNALGRRLRGWSPALRRLIETGASEADIVHSHALWMVPGIYARRAAERARKPLVVSPRGMLDSWSVDRRRVVKRLAAWSYENRNLSAARLLHATSDSEADSFRRYGLRQPIAVLPNGIQVSMPVRGVEREILERRFPDLREKRWLLFFGRLDPKKGLDLLIELWREIGPRFPAWRLLIAGPDLGGFGEKMKARVAEDQVLREQTTFTGMLEGVEKRAALLHSELFVLPTRGENFGIAIGEALAHGTPVITTTEAPWEDLERLDCGWWVAPEAGAVAAALDLAMRLPVSELERKGANGVKLVQDQFSWDSIGEKWVGVYSWILTGGSAPPAVRIG